MKRLTSGWSTEQDVTAKEENGASTDSGAKAKMTTYAFRTKAQQTLTELTAAVEANKGG